MSSVLNRSLSDDSMMSEQQQQQANVSPTKTASKKKSSSSRHMLNRMSTVDTSDSALSESEEDITFNLKLSEQEVTEVNQDELEEDDDQHHLGSGSGSASGPRRISIIDPKLKANVSLSVTQNRIYNAGA